MIQQLRSDLLAGQVAKKDRVKASLTTTMEEGLHVRMWGQKKRGQRTKRASQRCVSELRSLAGSASGLRWSPSVGPAIANTFRIPE